MTDNTEAVEKLTEILHKVSYMTYKTDQAKVILAAIQTDPEIFMINPTRHKRQVDIRKLYKDY